MKFQILPLFQAVEEGKKLEESRAPKEEGEVVHLLSSKRYERVTKRFQGDKAW